MDPPASAPTHLSQGPEKFRSVNVIAENCFPSVTPIKQMIESACELDTSFPGHELDEPALPEAVLSSLFAELHGLTPFLLSLFSFGLLRLIVRAKRRHFHRLEKARQRFIPRIGKNEDVAPRGIIEFESVTLKTNGELKHGTIRLHDLHAMMRIEAQTRFGPRRNQPVSRSPPKLSNLLGVRSNSEFVAIPLCVLNEFDRTRAFKGARKSS